MTCRRTNEAKRPLFCILFTFLRSFSCLLSRGRSGRLERFWQSALKPCVLIFALLLPATTTADRRLSLSPDQIVSKIEQQLGGKLVSISMQPRKANYQLHWMNTRGQILLLTVDSQSAKILQLHIVENSKTR